MATKKGPAPAPLDPKVQKKLLDLLSTDNEFRRLFKKDAHAALVKAGWKVPAGCENTAAASGGSCMQLKAGERIAPKAKIIRERAKLEAGTPPPFKFDCPAEFKA
jgi:putative modified peptide